MPTRLIRSLKHIQPMQQGGIATIGNFDGVHLGHQQLIASVIKQANQQQVPSLVLTFEPHPAEFFGKSVSRLTRLREKFCALAHVGVENVIILKFNQALAQLNASDFVNQILINCLKVKHVIIGDDFHFGYQRQGNLDLLKQMGRVNGFSVEALSTLLHNGERVSSTRIRQALAEGHLTLASRLLGRPFSMMGRICHGDKIGRQWGFPTLNIHLHRQISPLYGVYIVYVHGLADKPLKGAASIGHRPTIGGTQTLLEVHLLDFNQNVYGQYVTVEFCEKLREEENFTEVELLKAKIAEDVAKAKAYFKKQV